MKTLEELNISLERDIIYTTEEFHSTIASYTTIMKSDKLPSIDLYDDNDDDDTTVTYGDVQWMHIGGIISDEVKLAHNHSELVDETTVKELIQYYKSTKPNITKKIKWLNKLNEFATITSIIIVLVLCIIVYLINKISD